MNEMVTLYCEDLRAGGVKRLRWYYRVIVRLLAGDVASREYIQRTQRDQLSEQAATAHHEAGHAVFAYLLLRNFDAVVVFADGAGGVAGNFQTPEEAREHHRTRPMTDQERVDLYCEALVACGYPDPQDRLKLATVLLVIKHWCVISKLAEAALHGDLFLNDQQVFAVISTYL